MRTHSLFGRPFPQQVGLASVASVAHFLGPGRHAFNNNVFSFIGASAYCTHVVGRAVLSGAGG